MQTVIKSVYDNQEQILDAIYQLYTPDGIQCDLTYGNGAFYKKRTKPEFRFDKDTSLQDCVHSCSMSVPLPDASISSVMFDPPFLTYIKAAREHNSIMGKRFGGYWRYDELAEHYKGTAKEAARILKKGGLFVVKCQDIIHNHKMHATHHNMVEWCKPHGLNLEDIFILAAKHRMPVSRNKKQQHARIYHSYFLVFRKN